MAQGDMKAPRIIYRTYSFTNVPVTTRSGAGAYYLTGTSMNIAVSGYIPISVSVTNFDTWVGNVTPYIRPDNETMSLVSDVSQTLGLIGIRIAYIKND